MGTLSARNKLYLAIGAIVVVALAATLLVILPTFQMVADIQTQIDNENTKLMTAQTLLARRQSAKAQSAASEVELMDIANAIPDSPQLPTVIIELQNVANNAGVTLIQISPSDLSDGEAVSEGAAPAYSILPVELVLRGQWVDIIDFLGDIADLDRGLRIDSMTFIYVDDDPETTRDDSYIEASVGIEVYVMAAAKTAPALSDGSSETTASAN